MENSNSGCQCGMNELLVFACSGACDLGQVTDARYNMGQTPVTEELIDSVYEMARTIS